MLLSVRRFLSSSSHIGVSSSRAQPLTPFASQLSALEALSRATRTTTTRPTQLEEAIIAAPDGEADSLNRVLRAGVIGAAMEPTVRTTALVVRKLLKGTRSAPIEDTLALLANPELRLPACGSSFGDIFLAVRDKSAADIAAAESSAEGNGAALEALRATLRRIATVARARGVNAAGRYTTLGVKASISARDWTLALRFIKDGMTASAAYGSGASGSRSVRAAAFKLLEALTRNSSSGVDGLSPAQRRWCIQTLPQLAGKSPATPALIAALHSASDKAASPLQ